MQLTYNQWGFKRSSQGANVTCTDFNDGNSIMYTPSGTDLPDYIFMMERQGQIMGDHLGESGELMFAEEDC